MAAIWMQSSRKSPRAISVKFNFTNKMLESRRSPRTHHIPTIHSARVGHVHAYGLAPCNRAVVRSITAPANTPPTHPHRTATTPSPHRRKNANIPSLHRPHALTAPHMHDPDFWLGNVFVQNSKTRGDGYVTREEFAVITGQLGIPEGSFDSDANFYGVR